MNFFIMEVIDWSHFKEFELLKLMIKMNENIFIFGGIQMGKTTLIN